MIVRHGRARHNQFRAAEIVFDVFAEAKAFQPNVRDGIERIRKLIFTSEVGDGDSRALLGEISDGTDATAESAEPHYRDAFAAERSEHAPISTREAPERNLRGFYTDCISA
jgi:hypothetical protein